MSSPSRAREKGRVAIVTGGARGIGRAIAERLAKQEKCRVVVADVDEAGKKVAKSIGGYFVAADLAKPDECRYVVEKTVERFGTVDILVNNAGIQHIDQIRDFPEEDWDRIMAVMLRAPFILTKAVWPIMEAKKRGRIVNIASVHGLVASASKSAYVSAKHGLVGLTKVAALEGGRVGITVNAVCPAYVRTDLVSGQVREQARAHNIPEGEVLEKVFLEKAAVRRLIEPDEVAALVCYLCSDDASAMTGSAIPIDVGWMAR
jgi:3-hydroxybutyrate dehydrogenase